MSSTYRGPFTADLYKAIMEEEHWFLEAQHKRESFYSSIITTVLAATIAGALGASAGIHYLFLLVGPAMVITLANLGRKASERFYRRYLETVTMRAKLEQAMGYTLPLPAPKTANPYWAGEPLIPARHLGCRTEYNNSKEFCEKLLPQGYQGTTNRHFGCVKWFAWSLIVLLVFGALWKTLQTAIQFMGDRF